jgi:hypothetical protein
MPYTAPNASDRPLARELQGRVASVPPLETAMRHPATPWTVLLLTLLLAIPPADAAAPERDIVAAAEIPPVGSADPPGLATGMRLLESLRNALALVQGGVPEAARPGLQALIRDLRRLADTTGGAERWLPVRTQTLRVWLNAPDLRPRPRRASDSEHRDHPGNLPARAQRIVRLPVRDVLRRAEAALPLLGAGAPENRKALAELQAALAGLRSEVTLQHRPLIVAYYDVEAALAATAAHAPVPFHRLRDAASALQGVGAPEALVSALRTQAQHPRADPSALLRLALQLRRRIVAVAGPGAHLGTPP